MNKVKRNKIKRTSIKVVLLLVILICSQYILTGVYIGKEITGAIKKRNVRNLCSR